MADEITPQDQAPNWHVTLYDGTTRVGFMLVNNEGRRDETLFRRFPMRQDAVKIKQGEDQYSDNESGYDALSQDDWSGGRGAFTFERDRTRYADSNGIDANNAGSLVLGPAIHYAIGPRSDYDNLNHDTYPRTKLLNSEGGRFLANSFTAPANLDDILRVRFYRSHTGSPADLTITIRSDAGGDPGGVLGSATISASGSPTLGSDLDFSEVALNTSAITPGNTYWFVVMANASDDASNYWEVVGGIVSGGVAKESSDGSSWNNNFQGIQFRVAKRTKLTHAHFFEYKSQLYMAVNYDDQSDFELWMNGWRGAPDSNVGNLDQLQDSTQDFSTDLFDAKIARITTGLASAYEQPDWRVITSGVNGAVNVSPDWNIDHSTQDDYVLLGSNFFEKITMPAAVTGSVSDVVVDNEVVYLFRGELDSAWAFKHYNNQGVWDQGTGEDNWQDQKMVGTHALIQHDPILGSLIWYTTESGFRHALRPEVRRARAPLSFKNNPFDAIRLWKISPLIRGAVGWVSADGTHVGVTEYPGDGKVEIGIEQGKITSATVSNGGSGYSVGDELRITEWAEVPTNYYDTSDTGSGRNATVTVTSESGGAITGISAVSGNNYDYSAGVKATEAITGGGSGATLSVSVSGFGTGKAAHLQLDSELDGRLTSRFVAYVRSKNVTIPAGDIQYLLDDDLDASDPFLIINAPLLKAHQLTQVSDEYDAEDFDDLEQINSVGIQVTDSTKTLVIDLRYGAWLHGDFEPIPVGEAGETITNLLLYGDPKTAWLLTDRNLYEMRNGNPIPIQLEEFRSVKSSTNGVAATVNDVYLYFNLRRGAHRYYRQNLENVSPKTEYTFKAWEKDGSFASAATYPGMVIWGTDGTNLKTSRKSTIMALNGRAWHEMWTSDSTDEKVRSLYIQSVEGHSDRLWASTGKDIIWMPLQEDSTLNVDTDSDYRYRPEGTLETAWITTGKPDLVKVFKSITLFTENLGAGGGAAGIDVYYKTDNNTSWNEVGTVDQSPTEELRLVAGDFVTAKRIKFKFRFRASTGFAGPIMHVWVLKYYAIEPIKYGYSWLTELTEGDLSINLQGDEDQTWGTFDNVEDAMDKLDEWAQQTTPLIQDSIFSIMDNKDVRLKVAPSQSQKALPDEQIEEHIVQVTTEEI